MRRPAGATPTQTDARPFSRPRADANGRTRTFWPSEMCRPAGDALTTQPQPASPVATTRNLTIGESNMPLEPLP
jgi:hypothetical protein